MLIFICTFFTSVSVTEVLLHTISIGGMKLLSCFCELLFQNKLHSSVCEERTIASIGIHDFRKLRPPLIYGAIDPDVLKVAHIMFF